jgi:hypothetical protein
VALHECENQGREVLGSVVGERVVLVVELPEQRGVDLVELRVPFAPFDWHTLRRERTDRFLKQLGRA